MLLRSFLVAGTMVAGTFAHAGSDFGTREEAKALAEAMIAVVEADGIDAGIQAMYDPDFPFMRTRMGVNLFQGSIIIADNREPETVAADYTTVADLTGEVVWPRILEAAAAEDDAQLSWYHYDTQQEYLYDCFSMRADRDDGLVMVCR